MRFFRLLLLPLVLLLLACESGADAGAAPTETGETVFYFTRHAEKAGGQDPELLPAGTDRADRLAARLGDQPIAAVYATGFRRTQATAAPVARALNLRVQTYSASTSAAKLTRKWLRKHAGQTVFVVGHSNTVPGLVNALIGESRFADIDEDNYDKLFRVTVDARGRGTVEELSSGE